MNKRKKKLFDSWFYLVTCICGDKNLPDLPVLNCPSCGIPGIDFQFVGDIPSKIGYLSVWCPSCLHGIVISRVGLPDNDRALPFAASKEEIVRRIPNFTHVHP